tara:strand:+ start:3196 stop:3771 length:576 start_codon:yes stop_codon:yes gene_type:complete
MAETYDEIIGRLREEYQLDLIGIENEDDLKKALENITRKVDSQLPLDDESEWKDKLTKNAKIFLSESEQAQSEITNTSISKIQSTDSIRVISRLQQQADVLPADVGGEIVEQGEERKKEVVLDFIEDKLTDADFTIQDGELFSTTGVKVTPQSFSKGFTPTGGTITLPSAKKIIDRFANNLTINEKDIEFK